jgi:hypothetical protein
MGEELRRLLTKTQQQFPDIVMEIRGKGLFNAVELYSKSLFPATAYDLCIKLKERGILAKPTHNATIRLTPPLSIRYNFIISNHKLHMMIKCYSSIVVATTWAASWVMVKMGWFKTRYFCAAQIGLTRKHLFVHFKMVWACMLTKYILGDFTTRCTISLYNKKDLSDLTNPFTRNYSLNSTHSWVYD